MGINPVHFPMLTPDQAGSFNIFDAVTKGMKFPQELQEMKLANAIKQVQANYAEPNAQAALKTAQQHNEFDPRIWNSEIGLRSAQAANYGAETNKTNQMLPLEKEKLRLANQLYPELTQSQIDLNKMGGRNMGVGQKELFGLQRQLQMDHPDWDSNMINQAASAYLSGNNTLPDGTQLPELSGIGRSYIAQIQKRSSTAAVQNQAANMSILADDLNNIDIEPVKRFSGLSGRLDYAKYSAQMAAGQPVPQEFRDYETFKNVTSNFSMDALRKGFGTSVVPGYVYATLGKAANPSSTWWHDPKQVENDWNATKKWINDNAKKYRKVSTQGISSLGNSEAVSKTMKGENKRKVWTRNSQGQLVEASS